jgi:hypothetical protein
MEKLLQPSARDLADLLEGTGELGVAVVREPLPHLAHHAFTIGVEPQRDDAREAELLAIAAVQAVHFLELAFRQSVEAEASLLARGVDGQCLGSGKLGVRARKLQFFVLGTHCLEHRAMQFLDGAERPPVPRALRDPRRVLENAAEPRNELRFSKRVHLLERHAP